MSTRKKKASKHLVTIGAHVPMSTKISLQALAESKNISLYKLLQEILEKESEDFENAIESLKDESDLLGN